MPNTPAPPVRWKHLRRFLRLLGASGAPAPPQAVPVDWRAAILSGGLKDCPAAEFRNLAEQFRSERKLAEADRVCRLGLDNHPGNLWLAMIHARIADAMGNPEASLHRWGEVVRIGSNTAPERAFKNFADGLMLRGRYEQAEAVVRQGMLAHPQDANLEERLARIAQASGHTAMAIQLWTELMEHHPDTRSGWIHRRIADALATEGLLQRALDVLEDGLALNPNDSRLQEAHARFTRHLKTADAEPCTPPAEDFTAHLSGKALRPFGKGICSLPFPINEINQHVPALLDFAEYIAPLREAHQAGHVDVFTTWGTSLSRPNELAIRLAAQTSKPLLCLEYGFINSADPAVDHAPQQSIIFSRGLAYFDATRPSEMEDELNAPNWHPGDEQLRRARSSIRLLLDKRVTKYNHAPLTDLSARFPKDGRRRVLLVDQCHGKLSVEKGLASPSTFKRMWREALALPDDYEILIKLHPNATQSGKGSYFGSLEPQPPRVHLLAEDLNPFRLFEVVDEVWVCTSQLGFEALMAGKKVVCFGVPFYAGWGLTHDRVAVPRRHRSRTLEELFHLFYIEHSRYLIPERGLVTPEEIITYFAETRDQSRAPQPLPDETAAATSHEAEPKSILRILIILPSPRLGASGRYIQTLAWNLCQLGCEVMVLAEGTSQPLEDGVLWRKLEFKGTRLSAALREEVLGFAPDIVYENGVRSRSQRAALEILILTGARLAMQSEDDDVQIFETHHGRHAAEILTRADKPFLTLAEAADYLRSIDLEHSIATFLDPAYDRWVEPVTRALCYRLAMLHTTIWEPFRQRLEREYGVPTLIVPPVAAAADFHRLMLTPHERAGVLARYGIPSDHVVFFIGGALYGYSPEYTLFLEALARAAELSNQAAALVVAQGRSSLPVERMAMDRLPPSIHFTAPDLSDDGVYLEMLKACDVVCSPGFEDSFNRYRLPSRLVKAMAMAKPILTSRCGFGESLEHGESAFLMTSNDPKRWADAILSCFDPAARARVGEAGRQLALKWFDGKTVARRLKSAFNEVLLRVPEAHGLSPSFKSARPPRVKTGVYGRNRYATTMQDALSRISEESCGLNTVIHLGAGTCPELADYIRMGASRIHLVEGVEETATWLQSLRNTAGSISVRHCCVAGGTGRTEGYFTRSHRAETTAFPELWLAHPDRMLELFPAHRIIRETILDTVSLAQACEGAMPETSGENLLVLELNGLEAAALRPCGPELLRRFRWIAMRCSAPPLCNQGTTPQAIREILDSHGFLALECPVNHSAPLQSWVFRRESRP